ncbi:MAG: hypothetical protein RLZZ297_342 [Chloroflexota bacterium]|jgi:hypothetical protein
MMSHQPPVPPLSEREKAELRARIPLDHGTRARIRAIDPAFSAELDRLHDERESEAAMQYHFFHRP